MLTLLSPAKKLNFNRGEPALRMTTPRLEGHTRKLAEIAKRQSAADLKRLMHISDNLAELNVARFQAFQSDGQSGAVAPAGLAFDGDVYWGLAAKDMNTETMAYAQDHLRILSGLYGLLRPLDAMQPYRLEMGSRLASERGENLYDFWGDHIAGLLEADIAGHSEKVIVNLASDEYFKAVDRASLRARVVTATFLNIKDGEARKPMYHVKFARGLMARWIMDNRVDRPDDLHAFDSEGYRIDRAASSADHLVFSRKQPPPKKG